MSRPKRRIQFIDRTVQGALGLRLALYCACFLFGVFCILAGVPAIYYLAIEPAHAPDPNLIFWRACMQFWPVAAATAILLPFLVLDLFRLSNRFAGPIYRIRHVMKRLAVGENVGHVQFRDGDYWHELADYLNLIVNRLHEAESRLAFLEESTANGMDSPPDASSSPETHSPTLGETTPVDDPESQDIELIEV